MIKILDVPTTIGKLTTYHDIELEDINCPFCKKPMYYKSEKVIYRPGDCREQMTIGCVDCGFHFHGIQDEHAYPTVQSFHAHVKERTT